jgi:hypothetical protein
VFSILSVFAQLRTGRFDDQLYVAHLAIVMCGIAAFIGDADLALAIGIVVMLLVALNMSLGLDAAVLCAPTAAALLTQPQRSGQVTCLSARLRLLTRAGYGAGAPPSLALNSHMSKLGEDARVFTRFVFPECKLSSQPLVANHLVDRQSKSLVRRIHYPRALRGDSESGTTKLCIDRPLA